MTSSQYTSIEGLQEEMVATVGGLLSPMSKRLGYSAMPLEQAIRGQPVVLVIGNYSSGKSTFINQLIGAEVQETGQAPTDDAFTVLSFGDRQQALPGEVTETREGHALINDESFPFTGLRKYGQKFIAHFRLKRVKADLLRHITIIDTPGMLDSTAEFDRGYDYLKVVGDLAQLADLVIVMFDPHKAGTIKETYQSMRYVIPQSTSEDRLIFVLNRADECNNVRDLLRVYGSLCWNLSQMLGRKDIPKILLTRHQDGMQHTLDKPFLDILENQSKDLKQAVLQAPVNRLDHLVDYIETHGRRLQLFTQVIDKYLRKRFKYLSLVIGFFILVAVALTIYGCRIFHLCQGSLTGDAGGLMQAAAMWGGLVIGFLLLFVPLASKLAQVRYLKKLHVYVPLQTQEQQDEWNIIESSVRQLLGKGRLPVSWMQIKRDQMQLDALISKQVRDYRGLLQHIKSVE